MIRIALSLLCLLVTLPASAATVTIISDDTVSHVRIINPHRLPVKFDDKVITTFEKYDLVSEYYSIRVKNPKISIGDQTLTYNLDPASYYTVFPLPDHSGLVIEKDDPIFFDATKVEDYTKKSKIILYDLSNINDYYIRLSEAGKDNVYTSGHRYGDPKNLPPVTNRILADPGSNLTLSNIVRKLGDFPEIRLEAGKSYTMVIMGTAEKPRLFLAKMAYPGDPH